jgi:hypothetical protein
LILRENSRLHPPGEPAATPTPSPTPTASSSPTPSPTVPESERGSKLGKEARRLLSPKLEAYLGRLLKEIPVKGEVLSQHRSSSGILFTVEKLENGEQVFREYDGNQLIASEKLERSKGEDLSRTFHDNGFTKALKWRFRNGSVLSVLQDVSGVVVSRREEFPGGETVIHELDQEGNTVERYLLKLPPLTSPEPRGKE